MYTDDSSNIAPSKAGGFAVTRLIPRESTNSCHPNSSMNLCEKPTISSSTLFIALTVVSAVLLTGFFVFLWFLHRRRTRIDKLEDIKDPQELDDYGFAPVSKNRPLSQWSGMPKVPPPIVQTREKNSAGGKIKPSPLSKRESQDSLTPSVRQATPVLPQDPFATR